MKNNFRFHLCCISMLVFVAIGCQVKRPNDVIPESKMENLLYDYHLAKAMGDNLSYSENYKKALYMEAVFNKYGTTEAAFDSSMVWYARNTEILSKIYEKVNKRLKIQRDEINHLIALRDKKPKMSAPGDSIDVWAWQRVLRLAGEMADKQYAFVLPADTNFKDRDTLVWKVRYHFLNPVPDSSRTTVMAMQIIYEKDTINRVEKVKGSGTRQIRLYADTLGMIKEIRGFIYYSAGERKGIMLADKLELTRYHCSDSLSVSARDSLNKERALRADSLKNKQAKPTSDSLKQIDDKDQDHIRLTPEEMNRRRSGERPMKRQEQVETEEHILQERIEQRRERQLNQRRNQSNRRQNPR